MTIGHNAEYSPAVCRLTHFWSRTIFQSLDSSCSPNGVYEILSSTIHNGKQKHFWLIFSNSLPLPKQAYRAGIYGRKYQWVIAGEYSEYWWTKSEKFEKSGNCSTKELLKAIEGYILIDVLPLSSSNIMTASGMVSSSGKLFNKKIAEI